jgi:Domain of unknown function (DUF4386)
VSRRLSWLAASFNFLALTLELLQLIPRGVFIGIGFHAFHCFLIGYLIFTSTFLPRILGALMALAGLCWLAFLSPTLTNYLFPYNLALGLLGEASVSLWSSRWASMFNDGGSRQALESRLHQIRSARGC